MFGSLDPEDTLGTAMALVYSWVLWKGSLMIYALHLTAQQESKGVRLGSWIALVLIMLAIDILLTIFAIHVYS